MSANATHQTGVYLSFINFAWTPEALGKGGSLHGLAILHFPGLTWTKNILGVGTN